MGENKFDLDYVGELVEWAPWDSIIERFYVYLWGQITGAIYSGFDFVVGRLFQNVSAYRPDCLFQIVTGFWEVTPAIPIILRTYRTDHG